MPRPTSATTVSRPDLGQLAYEYMFEASQRGFIGTRVLPIFTVQEQSGEYPVIPLESLLKLPETKRAARGAYGRGDWEFEMGNYNCEEHGWEEPVDDSEARLYARFFDAEEVATLRCVDNILRGQEKRIADMLFNTSNFTAHDVSNEWDDADNASPRDDVKAGAKALRDNTGLEPNALIIGKSVFDNVMSAKALQDYIKYTNPILVQDFEAQRRLLSQFLGVEVLVGNAIYDSADKGQTFSASDIWSDEYGMLGRIAGNARDLREPCLGRTFLWTADSPSPVMVEQYREEQIRANVYRSRNHVDECFVFPGAGYLLGNLTT